MVSEFEFNNKMYFHMVDTYENNIKNENIHFVYSFPSLLLSWGKETRADH